MHRCQTSAGLPFTVQGMLHRGDSQAETWPKWDIEGGLKRRAGPGWDTALRAWALQATGPSPWVPAPGASLTCIPSSTYLGTPTHPGSYKLPFSPSPLPAPTRIPSVSHGPGQHPLSFLLAQPPPVCPRVCIPHLQGNVPCCHNLSCNWGWDGPSTQIW